jgi:histidinol-phosphatase (PHP family)
MHTHFSPDGKNPEGIWTTPEVMIEAAVKNGLDGICFTEHCECNNSVSIRPQYPRWPLLDADGYFDTVSALKNKYPLKICVGVEIGQGTQGPECAKRYIDAKPWDFILASNHNLRGEYDFSYMGYDGKDLDDLCKRYFEELYEVVEWGQFDVLAHLFYFIRYFYRAGYEYDIRRCNSLMADVFRLLIKKDKGIEVNTSSLNGPYKNTIPGLDQLKLYRELGGEIVTIGSDAHYPDNVGLGGDITREMMREAGFKYVAFYENRKPSFMPI